MYSSKLEGNTGAMARRAHLTGILMGYSQFATFAIYGLIIWFGGYELNRGRASFEDMLKVGVRQPFFRLDRRAVGGCLGVRGRVLGGVGERVLGIRGHGQAGGHMLQMGVQLLQRHVVAHVRACV